MGKVQEKHQERKKKLYYAFVDLEKEFMTTKRGGEMGFEEAGVDECLIRTAMALYTEACTVVKIDSGLS